MARIDNLQNFITDVGQAIKDKKGIPTEQKILVRDFDTEIASIETGGGDPMPSDEEVLDNEIYMLVDVPNTDEVLFTFKATFTGSAFIDTGDGNVFPLTSNTKFEYAFNFDNITNTVNEEGHKQVLVKVYGGVFTAIYFNQYHSKKISYYQQPILKIKMRATECNTLEASGQDTSKQANRKLKYFNYLGTNKTTYIVRMFYNCPSLTSIPNLDISNVTNMTSMFHACYSLADISFTGSIGKPTTVLTLSFQYSNLSRNKVLDIGNNLPITTVDKTIDLRNTPASIDLTPEDIEIFTDKGYIISK